MDGALGPCWLPLWSMQKVNKTHKEAELFPQDSLAQSNCESKIAGSLDACS